MFLKLHRKVLWTWSWLKTVKLHVALVPTHHIGAITAVVGKAHVFTILCPFTLKRIWYFPNNRAEIGFPTLYSWIAYLKIAWFSRTNFGEQLLGQSWPQYMLQYSCWRYIRAMYGIITCNYSCCQKRETEVLQKSRVSYIIIIWCLLRHPHEHWMLKKMCWCDRNDL